MWLLIKLLYWSGPLLSDYVWNGLEMRVFKSVAMKTIITIMKYMVRKVIRSLYPWAPLQWQIISAVSCYRLDYYPNNTINISLMITASFTDICNLFVTRASIRRQDITWTNVDIPKPQWINAVLFIYVGGSRSLYFEKNIVTHVKLGMCSSWPFRLDVTPP